MTDSFNAEQIPRAVLDANTLYPAGLRDLLMTLAVRGLFLPIWSEQIHAEWIRNVAFHNPHLGHERLQRTKAMMLEFVPNVMVTGYEPLIADLHLPDPDDRHVLAVAIHGQAEVIVTNNLKDFPLNIVRAYSVSVVAAEAFVMSFAASNPDQVLASLRFQRNSLKNPPVSPSVFLNHLEVNGLVAFVAWVKAQGAQI